MAEALVKTTQDLQGLARRLLEEGQVDLVIGYGEGAGPIFVTTPEDAEKLLWNDSCTANLITYLTKPEIRALGRPAVVAKGCDVRSLVVLMLENQVSRDDVVVIGVGCEGVRDERGPLPKCRGCQVRTPGLYDHLVGDEAPPGTDGPDGSEVERLEGMTREERWPFWQEVLRRCIKCYACRAVCPLCYCEKCFVDQTRPAWTSSSSTPRENFVFHLFRAFHLAGRCVGCGECQRACPQGIPLGLLNGKMARDVSALYGHTPGMDPERGSPLCEFDKDDPEDFIR